MAIVSVSTYLDAPVEIIRGHALTPRLLHYVTQGMIKFKLLEPETFPEVWAPGEYKVQMLWKGFLPIGEQIIGIELPPTGTDGVVRIRDNGRSGLIKSWDHMIELKPDGSGTHYTDQLEIKAGVLTPFIWVFASLFYRHRQRRWQRLVKNNFDYGA